MRLKPKLINKQLKKKVQGKCYFCPINDYALLDVHRIIPGSEEGKYTDYNTLVICSNCHRKIHEGKIKVLGKYPWTGGGYIVNYLDEDGKEQWK